MHDKCKNELLSGFKLVNLQLHNQGCFALTWKLPFIFVYLYILYLVPSKHASILQYVKKNSKDLRKILLMPTWLEIVTQLLLQNFSTKSINSHTEWVQVEENQDHCCGPEHWTSNRDHSKSNACTSAPSHKRTHSKH